ncbi:unnamed protein product [Notodromas monacha]|uniref:Apical junction molecule ajm1 alpha/beta domain-containing protein n=1 Tax=Notodromas monacha TaxID=399045 RepID=A0A7R9BQ96_9CRUS|nr:unnamed protein product [Notodromas monacha]CAG0918320.1 unnamed protein product [Notodromas monacha]
MLKANTGSGLELEPLLPGSRGSGKATLTPSPEPFFFEDLEIKIMETDLHRDSPFASTPASLGDAISPTGATAGNSVASISSPGPAGLIAMSHILIQCRNSKCPNGCHIEEAQKLYKTCKNCHTYYCSRECRRAHKPKHQKHCMQLRASSLLTDLMHQIRDVPECFLQLSKLARQGYLSRGAGCVKLFFQTVDELQDFLNTFKTDSNGGMQPVYTPVTDLMPEEMGPDNYRSHIPVNPLQLRQEAIITQDVEEQETIIFVSPLGFGNERSGRILCRDAIIAQLTDHGVDLAVEFPDVDRRLGAYVERNESFGHVIFYPRDAETSKFFMCIVMLEVDPDRFGNLPADINNVKVLHIHEGPIKLVVIVSESASGCQVRCVGGHGLRRADSGFLTLETTSKTCDWESNDELRRRNIIGFLFLEGHEEIIFQPYTVLNIVNDTTA